MMFLALMLHSLMAVGVSFSNEETFSEISDLGNLLLGGFVLAVGLAIALTFVRLRMREKKPPAAQVLSINTVEKDK